MVVVAEVGSSSSRSLEIIQLLLGMLGCWLVLLIPSAQRTSVRQPLLAARNHPIYEAVAGCQCVVREPSTSFNFHHVCPISRPWCFEMCFAGCCPCNYTCAGVCNTRAPRKLSAELNETTTARVGAGVEWDRVSVGRWVFMPCWLEKGGHVTNTMMMPVTAIHLMGNNQTEINVIPSLLNEWLLFCGYTSFIYLSVCLRHCVDFVSGILQLPWDLPSSYELPHGRSIFLGKMLCVFFRKFVLFCLVRIFCSRMLI